MEPQATSLTDFSVMALFESHQPNRKYPLCWRKPDIFRAQPGARYRRAGGGRANASEVRARWELRRRSSGKLMSAALEGEMKCLGLGAGRGVSASGLRLTWAHSQQLQLPEL